MEYLYIFTLKPWHLIALFLLIAVIVQFFKEQRKQTYDDDFGNPSSLLSRWNHGFSLGDGKITRDHSFKHAVLIGQSGGGKTTGALIPTALGMDDCSLVFMDPAKELFRKTSGELHRKGYTIKVLDFKDPSISLGFNPLERATTSTELNMLGEMILSSQYKNSRDIFWPQMGAKLLVTIFKLQKTLPIQYQTLANTRYLVSLMQADPKKVDRLYSAYADDQLFTEYKATISQEGKLLSNVLATAESGVRIFGDDAVAKCTASDTLNLQAFRDSKTAIYIWTDIMDASYYSFLIEIFFTQLFREFMHTIPGKEKLDVFILADEMGSLTIKGFAEALANLRKYRVGIMFAIQSRAQLIERYGSHDAHTILANSWSKLIFPGMETDLAQELEKRLGRWTFEREDGKGQSSREVMTVSELVHMDEGTAILAAGSYRPMKVNVKPYFKDRSLRTMSEIPPPHITSQSAREFTLIDVDALVQDKKQYV